LSKREKKLQRIGSLLEQEWSLERGRNFEECSRLEVGLEEYEMYKMVSGKKRFL
jgi:hypothetical protein